MSILIKGLNIKEMVYCPFCGEEYGECLISKNREYCERIEKCPYEIIPDHGDLIDREKLNATDSWEWIRHDAPVVIPAERSEHG